MVSKNSAPSTSEEEARIRATIEHLENARLLVDPESGPGGFDPAVSIAPIDVAGGGWETLDDADEDTDCPFEAIGPSIAKRGTKGASRSSFRFTIFNWGPRRIHCDSYTEYVALSALLACNNDIVCVEEQLPPIVYRDDFGQVHGHYFDFRVTRADGTRIAIAVKPEASAQRNGFRKTLRCIARATPRAFADKVQLITDAMVSPELRAYSSAIESARLDAFHRPSRTARDDAAARAVIATMLGAWTIGRLVDEINLPDGRAYRAVLRAIASGWLSAPDGYCLEFDQFVHRKRCFQATALSGRAA